MKPETIELCGVCKGSGVEHRVGDPGLEDHRWCASCETGRAKARMVAKIVNRSMSEEIIRAA